MDIKKLKTIALELAPYLIIVAGFLVFVWLYIRPVWGDTLYKNGDLPLHVLFARSAKLAIKEGQFSYTNDTRLALQPTFIYYNAPFLFISGLAQIILKIRAYKSILVTICLFSELGVLGTYGALRTMNCGKTSSAIAAVSFLFTPYFVTDIVTRAALSEIAAFGCFPILLWSLLAFCRSPRFSTLLFLFSSITLFVMAHKIFIAWASLLIALLCLLLYGTGRSIRFVTLYAGCLASAMCLTLYYWLNAFLNVRYMYISNVDVTPYVKWVGALHNVNLDGAPSAVSITWSFLTANLGVFYPFPYTHPVSGTPNMTLQVGPLITIGLIMSLLYLRKDRNLRAFLAVTLISTVIACSFFYIVPFWKYMPTSLVIIQFPYRMLMFSCVFGSIVLGLVLHNASKRAALFVYAALAVGALTQFYNFTGAPALSNMPDSAAEGAEFLTPYWEDRGPVLDGDSASDSPAETEPFAAKIQAHCAEMQVVVKKGGVLALPILYSRLLSIRIDGEPVESYNVERHNATVRISEGTHDIQACRLEPVKYPVGILASVIVFALTILAMKLLLVKKSSGLRVTTE